MKIFRGKIKFTEQKMALDKVLKMKFWIIHIDQERGVNLGNQHWEQYWGKRCEEKWEL